jgi:hypothetical protein
MSIASSADKTAIRSHGGPTAAASRPFRESGETARGRPATLATSRSHPVRRRCSILPPDHERRRRARPLPNIADRFYRPTLAPSPVGCAALMYSFSASTSVNASSNSRYFASSFICHFLGASFLFLKPIAAGSGGLAALVQSKGIRGKNRSYGNSESRSVSATEPGQPHLTARVVDQDITLFLVLTI